LKRIVGYVLFTLGLTLIFLAPFLLLYSVPRLEKAPTDTDQQIVSDGYGTYFSPKALALVSGPLQNIEVLKGDPSKSTDTVAIVDYTSHLVDTSTNGSVDFDQEVYAMNRSTGVAENCCGEQPKMSGQTLKFPFGTEKKTYPLWDPSANRAFPVTYARTEDVDGVTTYVFEGSSPAVKTSSLDLPNSLIGLSSQGPGQTATDRMYQADTTVWIEPETGQVIEGQKVIHQWAALDGKTVLPLANINVRYSPATVAQFASDAKANLKQLNLAKTTIPIAGVVIGIILAVVGFLLLRARSRGAGSSADEPRAEAA
jgi:hypothetical protein